MPKIDLDALALRSGTTYPEPFARIVDGREWQSLGDAVGLTQFGVNLFRLKPGFRVQTLSSSCRAAEAPKLL